MFEEYTKAKLKAVEDVRENLHKLFSSVFEDWRDLKSFAFTMYTPLFNDGDPCTFIVNEYAVYDTYSLYSDEPGLVGDDGVRVDYVEQPNLLTVISIIQNIPSEILQEALDPHEYGAKVTVYRDRYEIEEYEAPY